MFENGDWLMTSFKAITGDLSIFERLNYNGPIFLDIDLDFFCNIYDNNESDDKSARSLSEVCNVIDMLGGFLDSVKLKKNIQAATIAISPGFFPSSYWSQSIPRVEKLIRNTLP